MFHRDARLAGFDSHMANGLIESNNSLIQAAKAKARGYRSTRTLKAMAYLIAGKARSQTTHVRWRGTSWCGFTACGDASTLREACWERLPEKDPLRHPAKRPKDLVCSPRQHSCRRMTSGPP
jgi:Transposase